MAQREAKPESDGAERARSSTRRDLVESQIIQEATRLFAERGFSGTSLKDIADATGLTRPALYHYVRSKDEILARLVTELAEELVERYRKSRRQVLREFEGVIAEGSASGELRAVDARTAALSIIGQCNWVAWWHKSGTPEENERVADTIADLAVASVRSPESAEQGGDPRRRALARLRREVDHLEKLLEK